MLDKRLHRIYYNFVISLYLLAYFETTYKEFMCTQVCLYIYVHNGSTHHEVYIELLVCSQRNWAVHTSHMCVPVHVIFVKKKSKIGVVDLSTYLLIIWKSFFSYLGSLTHCSSLLIFSQGGKCSKMGYEVQVHGWYMAVASCWPIAKNTDAW